MIPGGGASRTTDDDEEEEDEDVETVEDVRELEGDDGSNMRDESPNTGLVVAQPETGTIGTETEG